MTDQIQISTPLRDDEISKLTNQLGSSIPRPDDEYRLIGYPGTPRRPYLDPSILPQLLLYATSSLGYVGARASLRDCKSSRLFVPTEGRNLGRASATKRAVCPHVKRPEPKARAQRGTEQSEVSFSSPKIILPP